MVICFTQGEERWAIEARFVRSPITLGFVTVVPTAPAGIAGVFSLRGAIVPVLTLVPGAPARQGQPALLVEVDGSVFALRADQAGPPEAAAVDGDAVEVADVHSTLVDPRALVQRAIFSAQAIRERPAGPP